MSTDDLKIINTNRLAKALAIGIEDRGPHATGVAFRTATGSCPIQIHKRNVTASEFIKHMPVPRSAQVGLVHTRFATQGDPKDNNNNHPIANGGIVGVHNGHVTNDDQLFDLVKAVGGERHGEVDSEAIFAAIAWNVVRWPPKDRDAHIGDVLEGIRGGAAIAWLDESDPDDILHVSRLNNSPLVMSWTKGGSVIFASTLPAIKSAAAYVGVDIAETVYVREGMKYTLRAGDIISKVEFDPPWRSYSSGYTSIARGGSVKGGWSWTDEDWGEGDKGGTVTPIPLPAVGRGDSPRSLADVLTDMETVDRDEALVDDLTSPLSLARVYGGSHWQRYHKREDAITKFRDSFSETVTNKAEILGRLHAFVRVGTWIKTTVSGYETTGQVYNMPDSFPGGYYVLRVLAYNADRDHAEEWVLVARKASEFEVHEHQDLKSNGDIERSSNVVLSEEDRLEILRQEEAEEEALAMMACEADGVTTSEDNDITLDWTMEVADA